MSSQSLPSNVDHDQPRRLAITLPRNQYFLLLQRLVQDPIAITLVLRGLDRDPNDLITELQVDHLDLLAAESKASEPEEDFTRQRALIVLRRAVKYILTGIPKLEKFTLVEARAAWKVVVSQREEFRGTPYERPLYAARNCLLNVHTRLSGGIAAGEVNEQTRSELYQAIGIIDKLIQQEVAKSKPPQPSYNPQEFLDGPDSLEHKGFYRQVMQEVDTILREATQNE